MVGGARSPTDELTLMAVFSPAHLRLTIRNSSDLSVLRERGRTWRTIEIPALDDAERHYWERQLIRYRNACGCDSAAGAMLLSIVGYPVAIALFTDDFWQRPLSFCGIGALIVVIGTIAGKVLGVLYARLRFRLVVSALESRLHAKSVCTARNSCT
jgi:hypothetical protein